MIGLDRWMANLTPSDYEELVVADAVVALTPAKLAGIYAAGIYFEAGPMRATVHGAAPTRDFGLPYNHGDRDILNAIEAAKLQVIRAGRNNGKVRVVYYKLA